MKKKYVVLLSAGLDSAVNLYAAHSEGEVLLALTFNYGQRAAMKEISSAQKLTSILNIKHQIIDLSWLGTIGQSALTDNRISIPTGRSINISDLKTSQQTMKSVWVPNRNGIFLNTAAAFAEALKADSVIAGFNKEEATTFPDNSFEYLNSLTNAFIYSTQNHVQAESFTVQMMKNEIVELGKKLDVSFENIWPCYFAKEKWCGECESCLRSKRAFVQQGLHLESLFLS